MSRAVAVRDLRQLLVERFPDARPLAERDVARGDRPVASGLAALDRVLPGGGFPRGTLSVWAPGIGATAVLRATFRGMLAGGECAAWVDVTRAVDFGWPDDAARTPLLVQCADRQQALRAAELLLTCGAFGLVVLEGADAQGTEVVRLTRSVRAGGGALVALTARESMAAVRVTSALRPHGVRLRPGPFGDPVEAVSAEITVRVRAVGWHARATFTLPITPYDVRTGVEPGKDRRGEMRPLDPPPRRRSQER